MSTSSIPPAPGYRICVLAPMLFLSGLCALIYQVCWMREFRLMFGASTAASAAVIAIFVGGVGAGGIVLGKRADKHARPLDLYARLEIAIAAAALLSPVLLSLSRWLYLSVGGTTTLGLVGGTVLRLILAAVAIGVASFLMGGTLSAAVRAVVTEDDRGRRLVAWLYAINTLGAVVGSALATFFLLEQWGTRMTLIAAAGANAMLGVGAMMLARRTIGIATPQAVKTRKSENDARDHEAESAPTWFVLPAAAIVGFAFFLMEVVWYRMLAPILGGSVFTFGLILCLILLGIGIGGLVYAMRAGQRQVRIGAFALTCLGEAVCVMIAFALGDRVPWFSMSLRSLIVWGFGGMVLGWAIVAAIAVLPAAVIAGYQFPLLIALLGAGRKNVGRDVGAVYAWNTGGAIVGSLAGGFLLLPILSATGCWKMVGIILAALGMWAATIQRRKSPQSFGFAGAMAMAGMALMLTFLPDGPTAAWRHSGIGRRHFTSSVAYDPNGYQNWVNAERGRLVTQMDGVESSIGVKSSSGLAFVVNGKVDGHVIGDAATQVMAGTLGAMLHPSPRTAMVIGLGTGSTAGWIGAVPSVERVDVAEIEPAVLEFARMCGPVNADCMTNPKVHVTIGDARELLMTSPRKYDIVASEPSNPYRAGIASLFTQEYYQSIASRLNDGGLFVQWVQCYDVDSKTIQTIYTTLHSVFPCVESWAGTSGDMLLVASRTPLTYDVGRLKAKLSAEPFRTAALGAWRAVDVEGLFGHYVADASFAKTFALLDGAQVNTDDRTVIEFDFARSLNETIGFSLAMIRDVARLGGHSRPARVAGGPVDWTRVADNVASSLLVEGHMPQGFAGMSSQQVSRITAMRSFVAQDYAAALRQWRAQPDAPRGPLELVVAAELYAEAGDEKTAMPCIEQLRAFEPAEADVALARLRLRQGNAEAARAALTAAFERYRIDPWPLPIVMQRALMLAGQIARANPQVAQQLFADLRKPFVVLAAEEARRTALMDVAGCSGSLELNVEAISNFEPSVPWNSRFLIARLDAYAHANHPLTARAHRDLLEYKSAQSEDPLNRLARSQAPTEVEPQKVLTRAE